MSLLPPTYSLEHIILVNSEGDESIHEPVFPVVIVFDGMHLAKLLVHGSVHSAISDKRLWKHASPPKRGLWVKSIAYTMTVTGRLSPGDVSRRVPAHTALYSHDFREETLVGQFGISSEVPLIQYTKEVEGMPQLPNDWLYAQFIA